MKGNTLWIVIGLLVIGLIAFFWWRSSQQRRAQQLQLQQQQMLMQSGMQPGMPGNQSGLSGTLDSVGGVINSLSGLFGQFGWGNNNSSASEQQLIDQFTNECEMMYNSDQEVKMCIASKLNQLS